MRRIMSIVLLAAVVGMSGLATGGAAAQVKEPRADLRVASLDFIACADSSPTYRATIVNRGSVSSGFFNIRWIGDGQVFDGGHESIAPGQTDTHDLIWAIGPGKHTLTFTADASDVVPESNEHNNDRTIRFTFEAGTC
jgi:hypothetical protein